MTKIYGVQLKAIKSHMTSDGYATYANVYYNNKKCGEIYDDGVGAGMWAHFDSKEIEEELATVARKFYENFPTYVINESRSDFGMIIDFLEEEVLFLTELEKDYKSNAKKGFPVTLLLRTHSREENPFAKMDQYKSPIILGVARWDKDIEEYIRKKYPEFKDITVFSKLENFIIE